MIVFILHELQNMYLNLHGPHPILLLSIDKSQCSTTTNNNNNGGIHLVLTGFDQQESQFVSLYLSPIVRFLYINLVSRQYLSVGTRTKSAMPH